MLVNELLVGWLCYLWKTLTQVNCRFSSFNAKLSQQAAAGICLLNVAFMFITGRKWYDVALKQEETEAIKLQLYLIWCNLVWSSEDLMTLSLLLSCFTFSIYCYIIFLLPYLLFITRNKQVAAHFLWANLAENLHFSLLKTVKSDTEAPWLHTAAPQIHLAICGNVMEA